VSGVDLIRRLAGAEAHALTFPLLTTASGAKMGKTAAGAVWIDADLLKPYDFYQYWVNCDDRDVRRFLLLFSFVDTGEVDTIAADPRSGKRRLAWEVTSVVHGREAADAAAEAAATAFAGGVSDAMPTWHTAFPVAVVDALVGAGFAKSKSDARRLVEGGAVSVGEARVTDKNASLDAACVLWAGKKRAVRVVEG
jgi:tyrosyl-tRNA synthetase